MIVLWSDVSFGTEYFIQNLLKKVNLNKKFNTVTHATSFDLMQHGSVLLWSICA